MAVATYQHDLGDGLHLDAYAIDPNLSTTDLRDLVTSKEGRPVDLDKVGKDTVLVARLDSLRDLRVEPSETPYQIPKQLGPYRGAAHIVFDKTMFSGPTAIVDSPVQMPLTIRRGGYYDFKATELEAVPGDLLPQLLQEYPEDLFINTFKYAGNEEKFKARYDPRLVDRFKASSMGEFLIKKGFSQQVVNRLKGKTVGSLLEQDSELFSDVFDIEAREIKALRDAQYAPGKTLEQLMPELGLTEADRARYFGFAFVVCPNNGKDVSLVYRGKDLGIAPDCISSAGGTPGFDQRFFEPGFDFAAYYEGHITEEMKEEYELEKDDFKINELHLMDAKRTLPYVAVKITTPIEMPELVERSIRSKDALEEQPVLFNMPYKAINPFLERFDMWPDVAVTLNHMSQE